MKEIVKHTANQVVWNNVLVVAMENALVLVQKNVLLLVVISALGHVVDYVLLAVQVVHILQNNMKKALFMLVYILVGLNMSGQENYALETRFRNPVDTVKFSRNPTCLLFVHSHSKGHLCPTSRMQQALEKDSLQIRKERGIKLYVIYPSYKEDDIRMFDYYNPVLSEVAFYTDRKYKGSFSEGTSTPFVVLYDGKGNVFTKSGGTYEELCELIKTKIPRICRNRKNKIIRNSHNPKMRR